MQEAETICPYTGLRPFTEEESLYFKGREEHILKVTAQLEEKKFLMVTGASGDGKSSLIFAGLLPQARAGFFKAKYSSWQVANFRPERSPLKNMARAIGGALQLEDPDMVEVELSRGFSSLVELYKSSDRYVDQESEGWKNASDDERNRIERQSGNLLILIDQFEEFFTNPENFPGGVPSQESRLLLNIILETIKISLKEDLPIYVVCTMRSDYIGQCAAFRGLPEFIGFSQFFVPRLQRKELHQVIEEPAMLSGNSISKRLIDRLIFDLEDGTDQLPILQHALKQIWKAADNGREEMDLIHYAMAGGVPGDKLPKEEISRFQSWKETLPEYEKNYLEYAGLSNVLDIHANKLYEEAADYYNSNTQSTISSKQAKFVIAISFACLTRIDESRAVRNRMTLEEITQIINVPQLNTEVVGGVLSIFREPNNTLIGPFISEQGEGKVMKPDTVIDITHEALIRNWKLLKKWAAHEHEYYETFLDFQQQCNRWIEHNKSGDFLLPIGPLTYFENWYKNCRPNKFWINRYNHDETDPVEKLKKSEVILKNSREFIRKSALRLLITRTFMKYGAARISIAAGLIALLSLSVYFLYQWRIQDNEYVLNKLLTDSEAWLADLEPDPFSKGVFIVAAERWKPGYLKHLVSVLPEQQAIEAAINSFIPFAEIDLKGNPPMLLQILLLSDSLIQKSGERIDSLNNLALTIHLNNLNDLVRNQTYYLYFNSNTQILEQRNRNVQNQGVLLSYILTKGKPSKQLDMKTLHITATDVINNKGFLPDEISVLINSISPLEGNEVAKEKFKTWFPSREKIPAGILQNIPHNGGYQMLAYLYAAVGSAKQALRCLDTLRKYNPTYDKAFINSTHVGASFLIYGNTGEFKEFTQAYTKSLGIPALAYVNEILSNTGVAEVANGLKFFKRGNFNNSLSFLDQVARNNLFNYARELCFNEPSTPDARNFNLAQLYKLEGVLLAKKAREVGIDVRSKSDSLFQTAFNYYNKVSSAYLEEKILINIQTFQLNTDKRSLPRKYHFLYPDQLKAPESFIQPTWFRFYGTDFFKFMIRNNVFAKYYKDQDDYQMIIAWINSYFFNYGRFGNRTFMNYPDLTRSTFISLDSLISKSGYDLDDAWIKLFLIQDYFNAGDTLNAYTQFKSLKFKEFEKVNFEESPPFHNAKIRIAAELAYQGKRAEAIGIVRRFNNRGNRISSYARLAALVYKNGNTSEAEVYLDSANAELIRIKNYSNANFPMHFAEILTLKGDRKSMQQAVDHIGSTVWFGRLLGLAYMSIAHSWKKEYYKSVNVVPVFASTNDRLWLTMQLLIVANWSRGEATEEWKRYDYLLKNNFEEINFQNDLIEN